MAGKFTDLEQKCKKTAEHFRKELQRLRTGRASASLLEGLTVEYYGSTVPLIQLGMINAPEPRLLTIQVYDGGACEAIEKAIKTSDLGLNPARDGTLLRIPIPALTEERRKELVKKTHKMAEEVKVILRNHRRDTLDALKKQEKDKAVSADDVRRGSDEIQKITDKATAEVDQAVAQKEKEIMEV
ncbi:MAG: ribosome recycling factor [Oligoflexia bacterium]|nr:ribosome recycling factor [Oligoflexia bacterium]